MLSIDNLHAQVEGKGILKGINLDIKPGEVHAIMGPNGSGKSTLSTVIAGHEDYEVTKGSLLYQGADISDLSADERAHLGIFLSFQYPVEIPGVTVTNFIKTAINETRKGQGLEEMPALLFWVYPLFAGKTELFRRVDQLYNHGCNAHHQQRFQVVVWC